MGLAERVGSLRGSKMGLRGGNRWMREGRTEEREMVQIVRQSRRGVRAGMAARQQESRQESQSDSGPKAGETILNPPEKLTEASRYTSGGSSQKDAKHLQGVRGDLISKGSGGVSDGKGEGIISSCCRFRGKEGKGEASRRVGIGVSARAAGFMARVAAGSQPELQNWGRVKLIFQDSTSRSSRRIF